MQDYFWMNCLRISGFHHRCVVIRLCSSSAVKILSKTRWMADKRNTTHYDFTTLTLKTLWSKTDEGTLWAKDGGCEITRHKTTKHEDDTEEMAANECEHFSAWKLKKHLELLRNVTINSILKGFVLTMLQALKDHQFLRNRHHTLQQLGKDTENIQIKWSTGH